ncbi:MAG: response regulator [Ignavibacteriales bacterium]|nr:MAG: response regulator [Ignavibacteriales bacterium]
MTNLTKSDPSIRILVIDDSDIIQKALKSFLQDFDIEVFTCGNGLEGIQTAVEVKPSLIFLDLLMPNFDGIKMLQVKNVLKEIKDIPVVIISANTNKQNVLTAIELGVTKVISKPLQKDIIIKTLKEIFHRELINLSRTEEQEDTRPEIGEDFKEKVYTDMKDELIRLFLNNFAGQKRKIVQAIEMKDKMLIKGIMHDIKGAGGTIGYNDISEIAKSVHDREINSDLDWFFVQVKSEQLFKEIRKLEELKS